MVLIYSCVCQIEHKAHGFKTSDPVINTTDDDKLVLKSENSLLESGVENESEITLFKLSDYEEYVKSKEDS
jgi:hypothetical protein